MEIKMKNLKKEFSTSKKVEFFEIGINFTLPCSTLKRKFSSFLSCRSYLEDFICEYLSRILDEDTTLISDNLVSSRSYLYFRQILISRRGFLTLYNFSINKSIFVLC